MDNKLYDRLSIINVKNKLNLIESYCNGNNIYVNCPFCSNEDEKNANLKLNVRNNSYYCNCCGMSGYAVGLYAKLNYITNRKAFEKLINQEADMTTNFKNVENAIRRSDEDISIVYEYLLKMIGLNKKHCRILLQMGFSKETILKSSFRSIPQYENEKIRLCNRLIKCGFDLSGVPGFFLNKQMKWTFKSHKGFFIPVIYNGYIKGLRIHLEENYKLDTTDIWFSSGNEYQGTSAKNSIMIFMPKTDQISTKNNIVIASEILIGHRLFERDNKITIAIPNKINKKQAQLILNNINISNADIYIDKHTISCDYKSLYHNLLKYIDEEKQNIKFILDYKDL